MVDTNSERTALLVANRNNHPARSSFLSMFPLPYGRIKHNKAFLVILWDFCVSIFREFMIYFASILANSMEDAMIFRTIINNAVHIHLLFYPIAGLIADVKWGRYLAIKVSLLICLASWFLSSMGLCVVWYLDFGNSSLLLAVLSVVICTMLIGLAGFQSNSIAFNIDQLHEASSDELSAIVYWHLFSYNSPRLIAALVPWDSLDTQTAGLVCIAASGTSLIIALLSDHFLHHVLDKAPTINTNPIKMIFNVLNYARKTKNPRNRSALTYWENECPSRIDLGKERYGGPFHEEQVENVKMIYKILPVFVSVIGCFLAWDTVNIFSVTSGLDKDGLLLYYLKQHIVPITTRLALIVIYQFVFHPFLLKYIPKMLDKIAIGLGFGMIGISLNIVIITFGQTIHNTIECPLSINSSSVFMIDYKWFILPQVVSGIAVFLVLVTSIEFTIAQSPQQIRGLLIGLWYAAYGIGELAAKNSIWPIKYTDTPHCLTYYFLFCNCVVFVVLLSFLVFAKCYKMRVRNYTVPVYQLVEEYTTRNI